MMCLAPTRTGDAHATVAEMIEVLADRCEDLESPEAITAALMATRRYRPSQIARHMDEAARGARLIRSAGRG